MPTIGNCASAQITASTSSTQRVGTRLTMKPTTIAEIENRRKNEEPSRPNSFGSSLSSVMIGTRGKADHDLVGEIHQHEQKQQKGDGPGALRRLRCCVS